jgi:NADP-dependent 3-hydroxy acid dehydrogenase YdfG
VGKTVVITGSSSGIGHALARAFSAEGAAVVGFARRYPVARLAAPPAPGALAEVQLDVTNEAAVRARFAEVGPIDVLVANAGNYTVAPFLETPVADLRATLDVHIVGGFLCAREALAGMRARRRGHIVVMGSIAAFRSFPGAAAYTAAKEGLRGLTRVLAEEARAYDVRVTGLHPGAVDTAAWDDKPELAAPERRSRMMRPERLAELVVEICARPDLSVEELQILPPDGTL